MGHVAFSRLTENPVGDGVAKYPTNSGLGQFGTMCDFRKRSLVLVDGKVGGKPKMADGVKAHPEVMLMRNPPVS